MSGGSGLLALLTGQLGQLPLLLVWLLALPLGFVLAQRSWTAGLLLLAAALLFWLSWALGLGLNLYLMTAGWEAEGDVLLPLMGGLRLALGLASGLALVGAVWAGRQSEEDEPSG